MSRTPSLSPAAPHGSLPLADLEVDAQRLAFDLRRAVSGEVRFDPGSRHLYATDASNYRQVPVGVVLPRTVDDLVATHELCRQHGVPITNRGGGTSLAGQSCNVAVVIDTSKHFDDVLDLDPDRRRARVRPGIVLDTLLDQVAPWDLTWGPAPATHNRCTIGGMIGNNSCGVHAFAYGRVEDNLESMEVLLYDGTRLTVGPTSDTEIDQAVRDGGTPGRVHGALRDLRDRHADRIRARFPDIPRRVSGYNLTELLPENGFHLARALVGTEGTCATILEATVELHHRPPERALVVLGYPDVYAAGDHVAEVRHAEALYALEGLDQHLVDNIREKGLHAEALEYLPEGDGWLLCEFGGETKGEARAHAQRFLSGLGDGGPTRSLYDDERGMQQVWKAREAGLGATAHVQGRDHWPGWEDSAVHPDRVGPYLRDLRALFDQHGLDASVYGHFGDGCIHCRIDFDLTSATGVAAYRSFLEDAADLVVDYGGSLSGEHGDGQQRGELLERMYGTELVDAMRVFKRAFDPDDGMNPGKVVDPYPLDGNLRLGADHRPWQPEDLGFHYPDDQHDWNRAQLRCVGVGKCRRDDGEGTMCPSYMVTHEEMHSTRGRARLLFEMMQPDSQLDGWRDEHVREALDLCLSCKGCTSECPVNVDMPTYKAEFLHQHYRGRVHPRVHYAMGLIDVWSRIAQWTPGLANLALNGPGIGWLAKKAAGVTTERPAPRYAPESFRRWFAQRPAGDPSRPPVLLFPDTFTDHFEPEVGKATVAVLEDAGYRVTIPERPLCCGRPLYDYGFLDRARGYLHRLIEDLRDEVSAGVPIVGVEPSCVAVFRDELPKMLPGDRDGQRLADGTFLLSEFLDEIGYDVPRFDRRALVHGHCHHEGALGLDAEARVLDAMGLDWNELDAGCCGLAGSFGFEAGEKFEVSVAAGERKLLPAIRDAEPGELIVANGFSCRTQIAHLQQFDGSTERRALHLAQVIQLAKQTAAELPAGSRPIEAAVPESETASFTWRDAVAVLGAAGVGAALYRLARATR